MITAIIPTFNRGDFLVRALDSVFAQTCPCDEVIVIDDGSDDHTAEILARVARREGNTLRVVVQENRGAAAARNRGIAMARGDLLCFLDSDDQWRRDKIAVQAAVMEGSPECAITHTREIWYRLGRRVNQKKRHEPGNGEIFARCLAMCVVGMSTVMVRRSLFARFGLFDESLPCCEDYDFWLRVAAVERFHLVDQALTIKDGGRPDQLSAIHRAGMDAYRIRSIVKVLSSGMLTAEQIRVATAELSRKCAIYGKGCLKRGRIDEAERMARLAEHWRQRTEAGN